MSKAQHPTPKEFFIQKVTEQLGEEPTPQHKISITIASLILDEYIQLFTKKTKPAKNTLHPDTEASLPKWAEYLNSLFPKIKIPTSGKYARCSPRATADALRWFFLKNPHITFATVCEATEKYVREKEVENWAYMRTSVYWIRKQNSDKTWVSDLENYCQQILDGADQEDEFKGPSVKVV